MAADDQHLVYCFPPSSRARVALTENRGTTFLVGPFLGPAIAGYVGAGTDWRTSFGVLTAIYGVSTFMVILFGYETYYVPGGKMLSQSRLSSYFGIGNTMLPKGKTLAYWCRTVVVHVFKFPLLMTGEYG
jgi:MFS family permease